MINCRTAILLLDVFRKNDVRRKLITNNGVNVIDGTMMNHHTAIKLLDVLCENDGRVKLITDWVV